MTVTRLGQAIPLMNAGFGTSSQVPTGGTAGQVVTSNGSNGDYWGENVARITANGSNVLQSPFVSLLSGSGISFAVSSNALTISGTGGGGGGGTTITTKNEGSTLSTGVTTLDFVGAGVTASGAGATTTVTVSGMPWYDVKVDGGCVGDGVTDDTAALQAAITAATVSGTVSATLYFPAGTYLIGGALQDTGAFNGQLLLPSVSTASKGITIRFLGPARAPFGLPGPIPTTTGYAIIKSTLTGATGTAAVISGGNGTFPTKNNVSVIVENLLCLAPDNPTFTFWNISTCQGGAIRDVYINCTSTYSGTPVQPTNSNAYGIKLPQWAQSNYTYVDGICIGGFYTGYLQGELAVLKGAIAAFCIVGIEFPLMYHASQVISIQITGCVYGMRATDTHYAEIYLYDIERLTSPSWATTVYDLDDASNFLHGNIRWYSLVGATLTRDHTFLVNGGTNTSNSEVGPITGGGTTSPLTTKGDLYTYSTANTRQAVGSNAQFVVADPLETTGLRWTNNPAVGELLLSSTASQPPVFADILTNTTEDDFVYGSR